MSIDAAKLAQREIILRKLDKLLVVYAQSLGIEDQLLPITKFQVLDISYALPVVMHILPEKYRQKDPTYKFIVECVGKIVAGSTLTKEDANSINNIYKMARKNYVNILEIEEAKKKALKSVSDDIYHKQMSNGYTSGAVYLPPNYEPMAISGSFPIPPSNFPPVSAFQPKEFYQLAGMQKDISNKITESITKSVNDHFVQKPKKESYAVTLWNTVVKHTNEIIKFLFYEKIEKKEEVKKNQ